MNPGRLAAFFLILVAASGCGSPSAPDSCVGNVIGLQPLHAGERWRPALGTLDRAQSSCSPLADDLTLAWTLPWTTDPASAVESTTGGDLIGINPGAFRATGASDGGETLLTLHGFVMPETYRLQLFPEELRLAVGEAYHLPVEAVDTDGQTLVDARLFATPADFGVLTQHGCLPRRDGATCVLEARKPGSTSLQVSVGRVSQSLSVTVE